MRIDWFWNHIQTPCVERSIVRILFSVQPTPCILCSLYCITGNIVCVYPLSLQVFLFMVSLLGKGSEIKGMSTYIAQGVYVLISLA